MQTTTKIRELTETEIQACNGAGFGVPGLAYDRRSGEVFRYYGTIGGNGSRFWVLTRPL